MDNYVGKRLDGRYEIEEVIGVGGMAVVYKAYDSIDDRTVAVKILKDEYLANEEFRRRFKNESKAIAVLSHQNIVKVYDVSFGDRIQYIVMEHIEGITLKEYIGQRSVLDWNEALYFIIQVLRALQHAHDKGIVHRDIKPQNIMLLENGTIKVADFGIARFSHGETKTISEKAIGSVHYMSPEQAKGEVTDEKADIYSVGVMLYEMLTGKLPFEADNAVSVALMQVQNDAALPRTINPSIPMGFEQITMKAMQKSTKERYQTAAEMLLDLEEFKRNPNIKFDYPAYYVDSQPTRYVGKIQEKESTNAAAERNVMTAKTAEKPPVVKAAADIEPKTSAAAAKASEVQDVQKRKTVNTKLIAVVAGVALAVIIGVIVFVSSMLKNGSLTVGGLKNIEVDNFIGKNYELEIKDNEEYNEKFNFQISEIVSSGVPEGTVCEQSPKAGEKVSKNTTVLLSVAKSGEGLVLDNYVGQNYKQVQSELESLGFYVIVTPETDSDIPVGQVIRTNPSVGTGVLKGSTVTVYYSADADKGSLFKMPSLAGKSLTEAQDILKKYELTLTKTEYSDSSVEKDYILAQSPNEGSPVRKGDSVILTVSSGTISGKKTINLPKNVGNVTLNIYADGNLIGNTIVDTNTVSTFDVNVSGNKKDTLIQVTLDDAPYFETHADFTREPVRFTGDKTQNVDFYVDVTGMRELDAVTKLREHGYVSTNIQINYQLTSSELMNGIVINQSPSYESAHHLDKSAPIVLIVGKFDVPAVTENTEPVSVVTEPSTEDVSVQQ